MTKVPTMRAGIPAMTVAATALALSLGLVAPAAAVADVSRRGGYAWLMVVRCVRSIKW
ncbi:Hypothetical protein ERS075637_02934 [Mycobacteroides abscessus]|nr:Hypothetical protein ERS075637_02934 [Mycobacteroides abscessus]